MRSTTALLDILRHRRPHESESEAQVIRRYVDTLPGVATDSYGNRLVAIGDTPRIAWMCHTDTVHTTPGRQSVTVRDGMARLSRRARRSSDCLGADDGAGLWLCREMILAGVPGQYIFHRAEECGGAGSSWISREMPQVLTHLDAVISFDRRGTTDIVTHQYGGRTASDEFAQSLADALGMDHTPAHGVFTDSANYADQVGECSNVSVGYESEHSPGEFLDIGYLSQLADRMIAIGDQIAEKLVYSRKPGEDDYYPYTSRRNGRSLYFDGYDWDDQRRHYSGGAKTEMERLVTDNPASAATLMDDYGISEEELREYIGLDTGRRRVTKW